VKRVHARRIEADLGADQRDADVDLTAHLLAGDAEHPHRHRSRRHGQRETLREAMGEDQVGDRDPHPVAALLGFRAVGVDDPHRALGQVDQEQPVGAHAAMPVAQPGRLRGGGFEGDRVVEDQVVVAERFVLEQAKGIGGAHHALHKITPMQGSFNWPAQRRVHKPACFCS